MIEWPEGANLIKAMGNLKRDNTGFSLYDDNPELYDQLGEEGVKFRDTPGWFTDKPYTVGNTIFYPKDSIHKEFGDWYNYFAEEGEDRILPMADKQLGVDYQNPGELIAGEEVPHVSQYRDKGLIGFFKDYLAGDHGMVGHLTRGGGQSTLYNDPESLEGFHFRDHDEKKRLYEDVAGDYPFEEFEGYGPIR
jgi:hypothetical protein